MGQFAVHAPDIAICCEISWAKGACQLSTSNCVCVDTYVDD